MMNASRNLVRTFTRLAPKNAEYKKVHPAYSKIHDKYRHFQIDNDLLVHQRGGTGDYVMFGLTVLVNAIGFILAGDVYYRMAFNKK